MVDKAGFPDFTGYTLDEGRIRLLEALGEGAYGAVYRAVDEGGAISSRSSTSEAKEYAVKIIRKAEPGSKAWDYQTHEITTHLRVKNHRGVVSLYGLFEDTVFAYLVLEYCAGGDLLRAMVDRQLYADNDALIRSVFVQLLDAVQYCHEHGVYHRDLKPDNILTNEDGTEVKLADFGLATMAPVSESHGCGSEPYMSPECLGADYGFQPFSTRASDIWSLGIIFTNLVACRNPWAKAAFTDDHYRNYVVDANYMRQLLPISEEAADIIRRTLDPDPNARIQIPELRRRVLAVRTFRMSDAEIARRESFLREVAASYARPACDSEVPQCLDEDDDECDGSSVSTLPDSVSSSWCVSGGWKSAKSKGKERMKDGVGAATEIQPALLSEDSSGPSSSDDDEPVTPETSARDPTTLAEIPSLTECREIGGEVLRKMGKDQLDNARVSLLPGVVVVAAS